MAIKTKVPHFYQTISDGWFNFQQLYAEAIASAQDGDILVEVGTWFGKSAAWMAVEIINSGKDLQFYCCDHWRGNADLPWMAEYLKPYGGSAYRQFQQNMMRGGVWEVIQPIVAPSVEATSMFDHDSLHFAMIDAGHAYDDVRADVAAWLPKIKPGGVLAGDDADWPGVLPGVYDVLPASEVALVNNKQNWRYEKGRPARGTWTMDALPPILDVFAYIPCLNRVDLLMQAVASLEDLWPNVVVIDQTKDGLPRLAMQDLRGKASVFRSPRGTMTFTQMQNWAIAEATARRARWLVFMHNDAACPPGTATAVLEIAASQEDTGILHTNYDALAVMRMQAVRHVGVWDETFPWYHADVDYYRRMTLAGWGIHEVHHDRVRHSPSQTMHSEEAIARAVHETAAWQAAHYVHKWGGPRDQERFPLPYNGTCR